MKRSSLSLILSTAAVLAFSPACKKKAADAPAATSEGSGSGAGTPSASSGSATAGALSDPQIAAIVVAANQVDIDAGQLALTKSKNDEVKKLAQRMVTDHTAVNKAAVDLVTKLNVTPAETDASRGLTSGGADNRAKLEKLDGDAFDRAYVDNEVGYHQAVIGVVTTQLIPAASNAELKAMLVGVKPALEAHLQHAQQVQAALTGGGAAGSGSAMSGHGM